MGYFLLKYITDIIDLSGTSSHQVAYSLLFAYYDNRITEYEKKFKLLEEEEKEIKSIYEIEKIQISDKYTGESRIRIIQNDKDMYSKMIRLNRKNKLIAYNNINNIWVKDDEI
jgi:hypothetical protein